MTWVAHLVETVTGDVGARLEIATDTGAWTYPLNDTESWSVKVKKDQLRKIDPRWWKWYRASVLVSWARRDGSLVPWLLGPIIDLPQETREVATLFCEGVGAILERRVVLPRDYGVPGEYENDMDALARFHVFRKGRSLGSIAQDIVELSTDYKLGGQLPIRYASPREHGSEYNQRTYFGYNLANNNTWKRLKELSGVIMGPDIRFQPEFTDDEQTHVRWAMYHGTARQPTIAQDWTMDLDTTSSRSTISTVVSRSDAANLANRAYWTGAGEDEGTLVRMVQDTRPLGQGDPLLEVVGSTSDSDNPDLLVAHARSALAAGQKPLQQLTITVDGSDPRSEIGRWRPGDLANVTIGDDWLSIDPGTHVLKLIAAKGDWATSMVDLEFQEVMM